MASVLLQTVRPRCLLLVLTALLSACGGGGGSSGGKVETQSVVDDGARSVALSVPAQEGATETWTPCAQENETCSFSGAATVRYGAGTSFATGSFTNSVACSNLVFGDPVQGVVKSCSYALTAPTPSPSDAGWISCATEGQACAFSGTATVRYGAGSSYATASFTNGALCTNSTFGDPAPGVVKSCDYKLASIFMRGVNLAGNNRYIGATTWATHDGLLYLQNKGFNAYRINTTWENMQPQLMGPLSTTNTTGLIANVQQITSANGYAIIDFHNQMRRKNLDADPGLVVGESTVTAAMLADGWAKVATLFKDNPQVIFNISNEPHDQSSTTLAASYTTVIAAIRNVGAKNLIVLDGNNYSDPGSWVSSGNGSAMASVVDSADNLVFAPHMYFDLAGGTKTTCVPGVAINPVNLGAVTAWARTNKKRLFLGEFGGAANSTCLREIEDAATFVEANSDVWIGWSNFAAYGGQAPYLTPDTFFYALDSVASGVNIPAGIDDVRTKLLVRFLGNRQPFVMTDLGPDSLHAWYRPGTATSAVWPNSSGNSGKDFTQQKLVAQPSVAATGGLTFTASQFMDTTGLPAGAAAAGEIVFAVVTVPALGANRELLQATLGGNGREIRVDASGYVVANDQGRAQLFGTADKLTPATKQLIVIAGATQGTAISGALNAKPDVRGWGTTTFTGTGQTRLGPFGNTTGSATIHELVIASNTIAAGDKAKIIGRLLADHGLQPIAPADYPYKVAAPFTLPP